MFHKLKSVTPLPNYYLLAHFCCGEARRYDMKPLISSMECFAPLADIPGLFNLASVDIGGAGISWNEDIDIDGEELWVNGTPVKTPFDDLLSFGDASAIWGLNESTLRKAIVYQKLVEGIDAQKFGKQWVVTRESMQREYGPPDL